MRTESVFYGPTAAPILHCLSASSFNLFRVAAIQSAAAAAAQQQRASLLRGNATNPRHVLCAYTILLHKLTISPRSWRLILQTISSDTACAHLPQLCSPAFIHKVEEERASKKCMSLINVSHYSHQKLRSAILLRALYS